MTSMPAGPTTDVITAALEAAIRAPSPLNTQPWRFVVGAGRIEVRLDPARILPVADPDGREARLACGAALFNIRTMVRALGAGAVVDELPDTADPELLGVVRVRGRHVVTPEERELATAIPHRSTYRRPFEEHPVPPPVQARLVAAAHAESARLETLDDPSRYNEVAQLIRRADRLLAQDAAFRAEAARWIDWTDEAPDQADGVPHSALGPPPLTERVIPLPRHYAAGGKPPREFERLPLIAVLLTARDGARSQLAAGRAMQRVLLLATSLGLSASFLSHAIEVAAVKTELDQVFRAEGCPHTLFRIGYGHPGARTPRRPVAAVTRYAPDSGAPDPGAAGPGAGGPGSKP